MTDVQKRNAILERLAAALTDYATLTEGHERSLIETADFRRAGPDQQGASAIAEVRLRYYGDGKVELTPLLHTVDAPKNKSEMYGFPRAELSVACAMGALAQICKRGIERAKEYAELRRAEAQP